MSVCVRAEMVDMRASGPSCPGAGIRGANDTPARWECRIAAGEAAVGMQPKPADGGLSVAEAESEFDYRAIQFARSGSP
jgi:hypothetical protein